jgi:hypothetical protein
MEFLNQTVALTTTPQRFYLASGQTVVVNLAALTSSGGSATILYSDQENRPGTIALGASAPTLLTGVGIQYLELTGTGSIAVTCRYPEVEDPRYLTLANPVITTSVSGTVTTTDPAVESNTAATVAAIQQVFALLPGGQIQKAANGGILTGSS